MKEYLVEKVLDWPGVSTAAAGEGEEAAAGRSCLEIIERSLLITQARLARPQITGWPPLS